MHFVGDPAKTGKCWSNSGIGGQQVLAASQNASWTPAVADSKPSSESPLPVGFREVFALVLKPLGCGFRGEEEGKEANVFSLHGSLFRTFFWNKSF